MRTRAPLPWKPTGLQLLSWQQFRPGKGGLQLEVGRHCGVYVYGQGRLQGEGVDMGLQLHLLQL
jgi:hypothetical protein